MTLKNLLIALASTSLALTVAAKPYVIKPDGSKVEGDIITGDADGTLELTTPQGKFKFLPGQYKEAFADKPADWDAAIQAANAKQYDQADAALQKIIRQHPNLGWDIQAGIRLIHMHVQKGDAAAATRAADLVTRNNKLALTKSPDMQLMVWKAQILNKEYDRVELDCKKAIAEGSLALAARAYIARGDSLAAKSLHKEAVLDYLRVVLLMESEKEVVPEALYKAGTAMEQLKDLSRAKEMYAKLVKEHSKSPYAELAKTKSN